MLTLAETALKEPSAQKSFCVVEDEHDDEDSGAGLKDFKSSEGNRHRGEDFSTFK